MEKNVKNLISFVDPAVAAVLDSQDKKRAESRMPRESRKRLQRERLKAETRKTRRFGVDVDEDLIDAYKTLGDKTSCPASQLVQLAMQRMLDDLDAGRLNLRDYRVPVDGPRYEYRVERKPIAENDR